MQPSKPDRLIFKIRRRAYSEAKFPLVTKPLEDELLSSWLIRLALLHRTMPTTFTNLYIPDSRNRLWSLDIDLQADSEILAALAKKSGVPAESLLAMTLGSFEGYLDEKIYRKCGGTPFINPLGIRGRRSTLPGLRYCPECLRGDERPHFRKKWRLAFSVLCPRHRCYLLDRCPGCGSSLTPYLSCKGGKIDSCYKCGESLLFGEVLSVHEDYEMLHTVEWVHSVLDEGFVLVDNMPVQSHLYFRVLHQLLKLLISRRYGAKLQEGVGMDPLQIPSSRSYESLSIHDQARMLRKAVWLLNQWPQRFIGVCERQKLFSSALLKDLYQAPFWYWKIVVKSCSIRRRSNVGEN